MWISQKTRNIGPKLLQYWPTSKILEKHYINASPMRRVCRNRINRLHGRNPEIAQYKEIVKTMVWPPDNTKVKFNNDVCIESRRPYMSENAL